ncbi:MAG: response regulator transcription factor [Ruminococcus sp.]|jgi:two-component system response regulator YesN
MNEEYNIMIVDDEKYVREAIQDAVEWENYGVEVVKTAANAPEALDYLERAKKHEEGYKKVDLILTDVRMPVVNGIDLIRQVARDYPKVDTIIISGYAEFDYARQALRYGAKDYLLKPISEGALIDAVLNRKNSREKKELLEQTGESQEPAENIHYSSTVRRIISIVNNEISNEDLSLKWISANRLFLNENYLGKLFQKETGRKFNTWLLEKRMTMAMRLMAEDPDAQIQSIADQTGYGNNSQYFSIAFKKYTGKTPSEYKKILRS